MFTSQTNNHDGICENRFFASLRIHYKGVEKKLMLDLILRALRIHVNERIVFLYAHVEPNTLSCSFQEIPCIIRVE